MRACRSLSRSPRHWTPKSCASRISLVGFLLKRLPYGRSPCLSADLPPYWPRTWSVIAG
jgi:hypothetical protein